MHFTGRISAVNDLIEEMREDFNVLMEAVTCGLAGKEGAE